MKNPLRIFQLRSQPKLIRSDYNNWPSMIAPTSGSSGRRPLRPTRILFAPPRLKKRREGTGGYGGGGAQRLEGWATTHIRPEGTPIFILYSFLFILYSLRRTTNGRPYIHTALAEIHVETNALSRKRKFTTAISRQFTLKGFIMIIHLVI